MSKSNKKSKRINKNIVDSRNAVALAALTRKSSGSMKDGRLKRARTRKSQKNQAIQNSCDN